MVMRWLLIMSLLMAASITSAADLPDNQSLDLFLLIGQSNMAGRGKIEPQDEVVHPRIFKLDQVDHWVPSIDPLHFDKPKIAGVGLGSSFARTIAEKFPDHFIGLIPCAMGGTSIEQWAPGGRLYNEAVRRAKVAQGHGTLRAILWHQGESDCNAVRIPAYLANLNTLVTHLRTDLNSPDLALIAGQLGTFHQAHAPLTNQFNEQLLKISEVIAHSACVTSENLNDKGDQTHFDSASLREFGKRYAAAYLQLTGATTQPSNK